MTAPLSIAFVLDAAGAARNGGLVSGLRVVEGLRRYHRMTIVGVGGDVALPALKLPLVNWIVEANQFTFARPNPAVLRRTFRDCDLVHIQLPFFLGFSAMEAAEELGIPVVAAHHVQPENALHHLGVTSRRAAAAVNRQLVKRFYSRAEAVVFPSVFARDELTHAGLEVPSMVISNGVPERFRPATTRTPGPFTLLSVGRFAPEKRQDVILEAVRRSRHGAKMRVVIAGKGHRERALRKRAASLSAEVRIGFVSDPELLSLYQSADLYLHASEVELESMAVLEAMRCGCPAVIADGPSSAAKQFALDRRFLFRAGDAQALAERLDFWFEHREALEAARAATLAAAAPYSLENTVQQLAALYTAVAQERAPRSTPALQGTALER